MKPFTYRGFQISPVHNYKDGKGDFEYHCIDDHENCGLYHRTTERRMKMRIDEKIVEEQEPHKVITFGPFVFGGERQVNITKFRWISEAIQFAVKFNGRLETVILNP